MTRTESKAQAAAYWQARKDREAKAKARRAGRGTAVTSAVCPKCGERYDTVQCGC